jgi:hypothetical protein
MRVAVVSVIQALILDCAPSAVQRHRRVSRLLMHYRIYI